MRGTEFRAASAASVIAVALWIAGCGRSIRVPENFTLDGCVGSNGPRVWRLEPGGTLRGEVADAEGLPRPAARVRLKPIGGDSLALREALTGRDGVFTLPAAAAGRFLARVDAVSYGSWSDTIVVVEEAGPAPRVQLCSGAFP